MSIGSSHLSVRAAIFITLNIMLGTGVFINTVILAQKAGPWGWTLYPLAGLIMFPIIFAIARLTQLHAQGNFYNFGQSISPFYGFITTWCYFVGKLSTASLGLFVFSSFILKTYTQSTFLTPLQMAFILLGLFSILNILGTKLGTYIQTLFLATKLFPLLGAIIMGLFCYSYSSIPYPHEFLQELPFCLPLILFCFLGFEASCSLVQLLDNPQKNAFRVIMSSFLILLVLTTAYQFLFYTVLGNTLAAQPNYLSAFPLLIQTALPHASTCMSKLFSIAIATSAAGGAYGILYSNMWNLFTLAQKGHLPFAKSLKKLNRFTIPTWCVLTETVICILYLGITQGAQIPLQYTSTLSCTLTYTLSIISLCYNNISFLSITALIACCLALSICLKGFILISLTPLIFLIGILLLGTFFFKKEPR